jgi:uncharacterized protein YkwD
MKNTKTANQGTKRFASVSALVKATLEDQGKAEAICQKINGMQIVNAMIDQWKEALYEKLNPPDPMVPEEADEDGNNPATGLPYTEEEAQDALAGEVMDKINAERVARGLAPLTRSLTITRQATSDLVTRSTPLGVFPDFMGSDGYLELLNRQKSIQEHGRTIRDSFLQAAPGAVFDGIESAMNAGARTSSEVIAGLKRDPDTWAALMNPGLSEMGASYRYNPAHPGTHVWNVAAIKPRPAPAGNTAFFADPAGAALVVVLAKWIARRRPGAAGGSAA